MKSWGAVKRSRGYFNFLHSHGRSNHPNNNTNILHNNYYHNNNNLNKFMCSTYSTSTTVHSPLLLSAQCMIGNQARIMTSTARFASENASTTTPTMVKHETTIPASSVPKNPSKKRIIVLGCGWGGFTLLKHLNRKKFDLICVSPRNHFLFTPLLASTAVGTLEFRTIIEPVRTLSNLQYYQANCNEIDTQSQVITCKDTFNPNLNFSLSYDYLVIACGARNNTFNTPGVDQYGFPLKNLWDSRAIRSKLLENFERASSLTATPEEREQFSTIVIVGGGPTSIEFSGELWDFLNEDVRKWYPEIIPKVLIIEVGDHILRSFDASLSAYAEKLLSKRKSVKILTNTRVVEVTERSVKLNDGNIIPTAMVVWNTGIMQNDFIKSLDFQKDKRGGIIVNEFLQIQDKHSKVIPNVFCIGDCSSYTDHPFPATAQVASQEGRWLANLLHKEHLDESSVVNYAAQPPEGAKPFTFHNLGVLAYIGGWRALAELNSTKISGYNAWVIWRSAYLTNLLSWKNRFLVAMFWFKSWVFGRDISRF